MTIPACSVKTDRRFQQIIIDPSLYLLTFILVTHSAAALVVWLSQIDVLGCLVADAVVGLSAAAELGRHWFVGRRVLTVRDGGWSLAATESSLPEESIGVTLHPPVLLWSWLIVLQLRTEAGRRLPLLILWDNSCADDRRRLRAYLRTTVPNKGPGRL